MDISITSLKKSIAGFFRRYHVILFSVFVVGGLAFVVYLLNDILVRSSDSTGYTTETSTTFDETTIKRIEQLRTRDDPLVKISTDGKRFNPFIE